MNFVGNKIRKIVLMGVLLSSMQIIHAEKMDDYRSFLDSARQTHGTEGERIARFLVDNMPAIDKAGMESQVLIENLDYVIRAKTAFPWSDDIPDEVFLNDIAPYAVLDEPRTIWRKDFYELASPIVRDCQTPAEAAQAINQHFFDKINVHYNTARKRVNQSPKDSIEQGMATCTGLSIIMVYACRSVGIPARVAGIAQWPGKQGNHTWVEVWHDGKWYFTGGDEFTPKGLDHGWFKAGASKAIETERRHAIWATTWKPTGEYFPLIWDFDSTAVNGVNVSKRYTQFQKEFPDTVPGSMQTVYVRAFESKRKSRLPVRIHYGEQSILTRSGRADLNDMPDLLLPNEGPWLFRIETGNVSEWAEFGPDDLEKQTLEIYLDKLPEPPASSACAVSFSAEENLPFSPKQYVAYRSGESLEIDGQLDEEAWKRAPWTSFFVDIQGSQHTTPRFKTRAKMLWDDEYFYIAANMQEPHLWATLTERDSIIYHDHDFEVFIDPDGDTHNYYEFEMNAFNTVWDLFLTKPYRDETKALFFWDIRGQKTAVLLNGSLNDPSDIDKGWTVELAFPWKVLEEAHDKKGPPEPGDYWKVNFSRVQWQTEIVDGKYQKVINPSTSKAFPEDNWVWSPTGKINMHMPEYWGLVHFSGSEAGTARDSFEMPVEEEVKWALRQVYYQQMEKHKAEGLFSDTLEFTDPKIEEYHWPPEIQSTWNLFEARMISKDNSTTWHISQDGRTWNTGTEDE